MSRLLGFNAKDTRGVIFLILRVLAYCLIEMSICEGKTLLQYRE